MSVKEALEIVSLFDTWDFDFHFQVYFGGAALTVIGIAIYGSLGDLQYSVCQ